MYTMRCKYNAYVMKCNQTNKWQNESWISGSGKVSMQRAVEVYQTDMLQDGAFLKNKVVSHLGLEFEAESEQLCHLWIYCTISINSAVTCNSRSKNAEM